MEKKVIKEEPVAENIVEPVNSKEIIIEDEPTTYIYLVYVVVIIVLMKRRKGNNVFRSMFRF